MSNKVHSLARGPAPRHLSFNCTCLRHCPTYSARLGSAGLASTTATDGEHGLLRLRVKINGHSALALIDSGSTHNFMSREWIKKNNLETKDEHESRFEISLADGSIHSFLKQSTTPLTLEIGGLAQSLSFISLPLGKYDVILGKPWLHQNNPAIDWRSNRVSFASSGPEVFATAQGIGKSTTVESLLASGRSVRKALRQGGVGYLAFVSVANDVPTPSAQPQVMVTGRKSDELRQLLQIHADTIPSSLPDDLPPIRDINHEIDLIPGCTPPSRPAYRLSQPEMDELSKQINSLIEKGFIEPSKSPFGAPVFFVKKADGSLRLVCDWRELNRITVKNKACLPNVDDLFDAVQGSAYFSKLDLHSGYNQVRVRESDIPKTAINTAYGHFQFKVMGFGLTNAPATFMSLMNHILRPFLRKCVVVFLDDILIYSRTWSDHLKDVDAVLTTLKKHQLFCKPAKCVFGAAELLFLGHCISGSTLSPDPKKLEAVKNWPVPTSVSDVRRFLGFTNFFRRFIDRYSDLSRPLEEISGKYAHFDWTDARGKSFISLKEALLSAPVLKLANTSQPFRVSTDASDFAVAGVLLQQDDLGEWHPVAYTARRLTAAEQNYTAQDRETLAVVYSLQCWRHYLFKSFEVFTDNMGVTSLMSKAKLSKREARWVEFLADFDFSVHHKPGKENVADALSRRSGLPEVAVNALEYCLDVDDSLANSISSGYKKDKELFPIINRLSKTSSDNLHDRYRWDPETRRLFLTTSIPHRLCVPKGELRLKLLQEHHDCILAGHPGRDRTYLRLARHFYWPHMGKDVKSFVKSCSVCQRTKSGPQSRAGLLQSLAVPERPWSDISMDFIMGLPSTSRGHDAIYTFVDRLTKLVHLVPTSSSVDAKRSAELYINNVFKLHGLSSTIVSDRDPRFTASFFQEVFSILGTKLHFSTASHPQSDGMTERVNRVVEDVLRAFVCHKQDDWDLLLPLCEFAINSLEQASTANSPFFLNYGQHPLAPADTIALPSGYQPSEGSRWLEEQADALMIARDAMVAAQARQTFYADRNRFPENVAVGDKVLVYRDFLVTPEARNQPSVKLRPKWFGPFKVISRVSANAFRLELPSVLRCHPVFNIAALRKFVENDMPGRIQPPPPPLTDLDGHTRYEVESILNHRRLRGRLQFLVKWKGYTDATWEPEKNLLNEAGEDLIPLKDYRARNSVS